MSVLRVPISISINEACALSSILSQYKPTDEIDSLEQRLAMSVAVEAKSQLWKLLSDLPENDPLKVSSMNHAWKLDDSDLEDLYEDVS